jgi:hypothetical protein
VVIEVPAAFPHLTMAREGLFTRLADHLGMEDIEFESPEFNRRYKVKAFLIPGSTPIGSEPLLSRTGASAL